MSQKRAAAQKVFPENSDSDVSEIDQEIEIATPHGLEKPNIGGIYREVSENSQNVNEEGTELPAVVPLSVGGRRFLTRRSTLCKYEESMLAAMFSGRHTLDKDAHGYYFIDSNGKYFNHILEFLRHDTVPPDDVAYHVYKDACYYNLTRLAEKLQCSPSVAKIMVREANKTQFPDYYELREKIIRIAIQNAAVDKVGEVIITAGRKEFTPKSHYFNVNHDCVADAAHVTVGPWESSADEETLIRCLEQDLMQSGFHIKPHEQRKRCRYYNGQNCQKSIWKITFLF